MVTLTEGMHEGEFIGELAMGIGYHVDAISVLEDQVLVAGEVVAAYETGTPTVAVGTRVSGTNGTVGNGSIGTPTADAGIMAGIWNVVLTAAGATAAFKVVKPDGTVDGVGNVGTAYTGGLNFTLADGSADFALGDIIPITVTYDGDDSAMVWVEWNPAGTDGSQNLAGIMVPACDATGTGNVASRALVRGPAVVNGNDLTWKDSMTAADKALGRRKLLALGIKVA